MEAVELKAHQPSNREAEIITQKRTGKMFLEKVVHEVQQGNIEAPFAVLQIKQLEKEFRFALRQIEEQASLDLAGTGVYVHGDYQIKAREGSRTVDYSECEEITRAQADVDEVKAYLKQALIGVEKGSTVVEPNHHFACKLSGEIRKLPKWKYNKSSIVLTKV